MGDRGGGGGSPTNHLLCLRLCLYYYHYCYYYYNYYCIFEIRMFTVMFTGFIMSVQEYLISSIYQV